MFNLNPDQVEIDFAEDAVFQVELTLVEFEFNMQALLDAHFHLYWSIRLWLLSLVAHDELFFFRYLIIIAVNHHVNVISQPNNDTVVRLKLLFDSVELKVVGDVFSQSSGWL
jgi:hypothetical protein